MFTCTIITEITPGVTLRASVAIASHVTQLCPEVAVGLLDGSTRLFPRGISGVSGILCCGFL